MLGVTSIVRRLGAGATALAMSAGAVLAHHPTGGGTPQTVGHGLLSGLGHPVIGPDHLAFVVAIGMAAGLIAGGWRVIAAFIAASMAGVLMHVAQLDVPMSEPLVALSVVVAGGVLASGMAARQPVWLAIAAVAGLVHGYAFGEAAVGAERAVIGAYLIGLAAVMSLIAWTFMTMTQRFVVMDLGMQMRVRVAGGILSCIGIVMLVGALVTG